jgi:hypothetical protein
MTSRLIKSLCIVSTSSTANLLLSCINGWKFPQDLILVREDSMTFLQYTNKNKYLLWFSYLQLQFDHKGDFQGGRCMQCMCLKICISPTTNSNVFVLFSTIVKFARVLDCLHNYIEKYIIPLHQYKLFNLQVKIIEQSWEKQQNFTLLKQISNFIKT